jgi:hypothetical protein
LEPSTGLLLCFEIWNTSCEPNSWDVPNQQDRRLAGTWGQGRQEIVDCEITICGESDTGWIAIVFGGRSCRSAEKRGVDALASISSNAIASRQKKASPDDPDVPVSANGSLQGGDPPRRARRNAAHDIQIHGSVCGNAGNRDNADRALELNRWLGVIVVAFGVGLRDSYTSESQYYGPSQHSPDSNSSRCPAPKFCIAIAVHFILLSFLV